MANVIFSKNEIEKQIKLTADTIEKINMMGIPAELKNNELHIEVLPNRPDLFSICGFLRAVKAFTGKETGFKKYKIHSPEKDFKVKIDSSVKDIRPYTACAIVKNIKFSDDKIKEIIDIQEKLHLTVGRNRKKIAIGIYPLEKINLPIKYEARKPEDIKFKPLEFNKELNGRQILSQHPTGKEYAHLLENMSKYPIFVDAKGKILSMPPIINSHETGKITENTKNVFVECSGFNLDILRKTLNIIVTTLADMGGDIYAMELNYGKTPDLTPEKRKISLENTNKLIGLNLKENDLKKLLPKMGYDYNKGHVLIPAWRTDILHEVDIIEDIAIAYGYENLIPELPKVATIGEEAFESKIKTKISEILTGLGLMEISSLHLVRVEDMDKIKHVEKIELENSKTDYKFLRSNLMINALKTLMENKDNEYPQKIFETGRVFFLGNTETGIGEQENLVIALTPGNFTEIKQVLDYLTRNLNITYSIKEGSKSEFIEGRCGKIILNNKEIGHIGEINPEILNKWNLKTPVALLEISLKDIIKQ